MKNHITSITKMATPPKPKLSPQQLTINHSQLTIVFLIHLNIDYIYPPTFVTPYLTLHHYIPLL